MKRYLNTRVWLMIAGLLMTVPAAIGIATGAVAESGADYWDRDLTPFESDMAAVIELVWVAHVSMLGVIVLAIALLAADPLRARLGAVAILATGASQFLAGGLASSYGYGFADGAAQAVPFLVGLVIVLAACIVNWNAAPAPKEAQR